MKLSEVIDVVHEETVVDVRAVSYNQYFFGKVKDYREWENYTNLLGIRDCEVIRIRMHTDNIGLSNNISILIKEEEK
jgi:hypothetical protein